MPRLQATPSDLDAFLERYRADHKRRANIEFATFQTRWNVLRPAFVELVEDFAKAERVTAPEFNVFRVLRVQYDEENTHSRLLAELFDPLGLHAQGTLFLEKFLNRCHEKQGIEPLDASVFDLPWYVDVERGTQFGRIDIVISCPDSGYLAAVENKIFANEQPRQLSRYRAWLHSRSPPYKNCLLVFLTPDGHPPHTAADGNCVNLSYREDLSKILRESLQKVSASNLRSTIAQYLEVIESLITA